MKIALIMLAAGNSRRFGANKLLHEINDRPMFTYVLDTLCEVKQKLEREFILNITVVTQYEEIAAAARQAGAEVLYNPHPEEGISSSLQIGLKRNRSADACLFTVSDQPWLTAETIEALLNLYLTSQKGIACVQTRGKLGNPCVFSKKYYVELLKLTGDTGGKHVITGHREDTAILVVENEKELQDIDRPFREGK